MRMVVIENKKGNISCLEMLKPLSYYESKYKVLTVVNKLKNPYHVQRIKSYYAVKSKRKYINKEDTKE